MVRALVLAAGLGSRIREASGGLPKPLMDFGGRPILAHNLAWLGRSGVGEVWINLHYGADLIRQTIGDGSAFGLKVSYVYEPELLGTAGALANLGSVFDGAMLVVYGDSLVRLDLDALLDAHDAEATVALYDQGRHPHTGIAGGRVQVSGDGDITAFVEGGADGVGGLVNAGVYAVEPSILDLIPTGRLVDFGREVFPAMLAQGRSLKAHIMDEAAFCLGLDTPPSLAAGRRLLETGQVAL